jgi:hypothetical protein
MRRHYARLLSSVAASLRAPDARGRILRMLTLTVRHSGNLGADRARIARAWARHRAWLASRGIRARYWLTWECAPGSDGTGHVHAHVIIHAPWYRYADAVRAWHAHTDGWSVRYDCRTVRATRGRPTRDLRAAVRAVAYVAAYVSGGAAKALTLAPETHAEWWAASYGRRAVSAHRGAWIAYTPHCPCCGEVVVWYAPAYRHDAAASLAELARAMAASAAAS